MKGKRTVKTLFSLAAGCAIACSLAGCGGDGNGATKIRFYYDIGGNRTAVYSEIVDAYNNGQGKEDGVSVIKVPLTGIAEDAQANLSRKNGANVYTLSSKVFRKMAVLDLMLELDGYLEKDAGDLDITDIPVSAVDTYRFTPNKNADGAFEAEKGASLLGLPNGITPSVLYYNKSFFNLAKINVISVPESEVGKGEYEKVKPHGYAEYLEAPVAGMQSTTNLAGDTVYKVFNNQIPMNWEELRYLAKTFTKSYNGNSLPSSYGYMTEWWFNYGWSVGGDCIGYDGENYSFTVCDKTPNYLVTAKDGVTVNGERYAAGEIVEYEDKINESGIAEMDGLYELPSQYDAFLEFCRLAVPRDKEVDDGKYGYALLNNKSLSDREGSFMSGESAIMMGELSASVKYSAVSTLSFDVAPVHQYREYVGGSTYYKGAETLDNEYLKVIGKDYGDGVYTGDLLYDGDTPVVGRATTFASGFSQALVIPKNSDPDKYDASWKFLRYMAGGEAQLILAKANQSVPNQTSVANSDAYLKAAEGENLNRAALVFSSQETHVGDWGYFEEGEWVTAWANVLNKEVRFGTKTLSSFIGEVKANADTALAKKNIVINRR